MSSYNKTCDLESQIFTLEVLQLVSQVRYDVGYANLSSDAYKVNDDRVLQDAINRVRRLKMGVVVNSETNDVTIFWGHMLADHMHSRRMRFGFRWLAPM